MRTQQQHVEIKRIKPRASQVVQQRIETAESLPQQRIRTDKLLSSDQPWILRTSGVSAVVLRRLASGNPAVDLELDLHGQRREAALQQLQQTIIQACKAHQRVIRIVHGRGLHSSSGPVIKQAVYQALKEGPHASQVLAVIPDPPSAGGACLILLRRSKLASG